MAVEYQYNADNKLFSAIDTEDPIAVLYSFAVLRKKSNTTGLERLDITAFQDNASIGHVEGKFTTMLDTLLELNDYGVVLPHTTFGKLKKAIEANYYQLPIQREDFDTDLTEKRFAEILDMICASIKDAGIESKEINGVPFYSVPVSEFQSWIVGSRFYRFPVTDLKRELADKGYIYTNQGRYDHNVKVDGKALKCISFYSAKLSGIGE